MITITRRMFKIDRDDDGSTVSYLCLKCHEYYPQAEMVWERKPGPGDPGKIRQCCYCESKTRMAALSARMAEAMEHPLQATA